MNTTFEYTEYPSHPATIASDAASNGLFAVIAVGGDGTINRSCQRELLLKHSFRYHLLLVQAMVFLSFGYPRKRHHSRYSSHQ
ncbi:MAG: hypothetical protein IPJ39_21785 [Saprospiraceae bacterium]|nr:hypothetical protein [Saprospiraceae bacterium]